MWKAFTLLEGNWHLLLHFHSGKKVDLYHIAPNKFFYVIIKFSLVSLKGPCKEGYWLVWGYQSKPICQKNPCRKYERDNPSNHEARKFWIHYKGKCMRTRTQGYCRNTDQVLFFVDGEARPRCVYQDEARACNSLNRMSRPCWAGQKYELHDDCRKKVGLWGSEDDHWNKKLHCFWSLHLS